MNIIGTNKVEVKLFNEYRAMIDTYYSPFPFPSSGALVIWGFPYEVVKSEFSPEAGAQNLHVRPI